MEKLSASEKKADFVPHHYSTANRVRVCRAYDTAKSISIRARKAFGFPRGNAESVHEERYEISESVMRHTTRIPMARLLLARCPNRQKDRILYGKRSR